MNTDKLRKYNSTFIKLLFLLSAFIYFIKSESNQYYIYDYGDYQSQIGIELVNSKDINFKFVNILFPQLFNSYESTPSIDFSTLYKYWSNHFSNYIFHQLKLVNQKSAPNQQVVQILQKSNNWHQSPDEDAFILI